MANWRSHFEPAISLWESEFMQRCDSNQKHTESPLDRRPLHYLLGRYHPDASFSHDIVMHHAATARLSVGSKRFIELTGLNIHVGLTASLCFVQNINVLRRSHAVGVIIVLQRTVRSCLSDFSHVCDLLVLGNLALNTPSWYLPVTVALSTGSGRLIRLTK